MVHLNRLPECIDSIPLLISELPKYKTLAEAEYQKNDEEQRTRWGFWVSQILNLPSWYVVAEYVALIQPSSGCSERIFSMAGSLFDEQQSSCLEDRKEAAVMIRSNNNWRAAESKQF